MTSSIDMDTQNTGTAVTAVGNAAKAVSQAWNGGKQAISSAQGGVGKGKMGKEFITILNQEAQEASNEEQALTTGAEQLVSAGNASITNYLQTNQQARALFDALKSGN
jgi:hypothetical protein